MTRSNSPLAKRVIIVIAATVLLASAGSVAWVEYQMRLFGGQFTPRVDRASFRQTPRDWSIRNVAVLSEDGQSMRPAMDVEIRDGLIKKIVPHNAGLHAALNSDAVIDGRGRFLIPALMDGHAHLSARDNDLLLYFANGVTHVREMGGTKHVLRMRDATEAGAVGPDMYIATEKVHSNAGLNGIFTEWTRTWINIADPSGVDARVAALAEAGFDAIKISGFGSDDVRPVLLRAAREHGIAVVGHLDISTGLNGLFSGGQDELAHVEELVKEFNREFDYYRSDTAPAFLKYVQQRTDEVAPRLKASGIAVTSTIWLMESLPRQKFALAEVLDSVELRYADPGHVHGTPLARGWLPGHNSYQLPEGVENDPESRRKSNIWWEAYAEANRIAARGLYRAGVTLMAGTDTGTPTVVAGFSLHDELKSLQELGLPPHAALATATSTPAQWLGLNRGKVIEGYGADLLLLNANPLTDITNTREIEAVIDGGALYNRPALDAMLAAVAAAVAEAQE